MTDTMKPSEVLRAARELICAPERWTQGVLARNAKGNAVKPVSRNATCWCAYGAITRIQESWSWPPFEFLDQAMDSPIAKFNDHHPHREVLRRFDKAIALAEQSEAGAK